MTNNMSDLRSGFNIKPESSFRFWLLFCCGQEETVNNQGFLPGILGWLAFSKQLDETLEKIVAIGLGVKLTG